MLYNQNWEQPRNLVSEALLKAADLLEIHGHCKHTRKETNGSMCLLGALEEAQEPKQQGFYTPDTPITYKAAEAVVKVMGLRGRKNAHIDTRQLAADWNNEPKRTAQEVIDTLRLAAKVAQPVD